MTATMQNQGRVDPVFVCWLLVWSLALSVATALVAPFSTNTRFDAETQTTLGFLMGGLSAAWAMIGTWIFVIDLPRPSPEPSNNGLPKQRMQPRAALSVVWLTHLFLFTVAMWGERPVLFQILLTTAISTCGAVIAWQWSRCRIHRGTNQIRQKRSIRQIMGMTATFAVAIAVLQMSHQWFGEKSLVVPLVVASSVIWLTNLVIGLGRWWGLVIVTIPAVILLIITFSFFVDAQDRDIERQLARLSGNLVGFDAMALLLLMLMRSSGHRWFDRRWRVKGSSQAQT